MLQGRGFTKAQMRRFASWQVYGLAVTQVCGSTGLRESWSAKVKERSELVCSFAAVCRCNDAHVCKYASMELNGLESSNHSIMRET